MDFDEYEYELEKALEKGELKSIKNLEKEIKQAKKAAAKYFAKDARINIRISGTDLNILKRIAAQEGIPYQTLISSVLHKYAAGRFVNG